MKHLISIIFYSLIFVAFYSCHKRDTKKDSQSPNEETPLDTVFHPSAAAVRLAENLKALALEGNILVGHQSSVIAGANGWRYHNYPDGTKSDFKDIAGSYPALMGWEWANPESDITRIFDYISYDQNVAEAIKVYQRGDVNTFSFHPYRLDGLGGYWVTTPGYVAKLLPNGSLHEAYKKQLDLWIAQFKKIKDPLTGELIPFMLRIFHEMDGAWFWWGSLSCTHEEYKTLFRFTIEYMRQQGLNNMLVVYAPGVFTTEHEYWLRYPGDDIVDVFGFDSYYVSAHTNSNNGDPNWDNFENKMKIVDRLAKSKNKLFIIAETGQQNLTSANYFTQLLEIIRNSNTHPASVMFWANYTEDVGLDGGNGFYIPYLGMNNAAVVNDFTDFINNPKVMVSGDKPKLYQ